jgi:hypothetical protein
MCMYFSYGEARERVYIYAQNESYVPQQRAVYNTAQGGNTTAPVNDDGRSLRHFSARSGFLN